MMPARFGEANRPIPMPFSSKITANCQYVKLTGKTSSRPNEAAASTMPPVANEQAPEPVRQPAGRRPGDQEADRQREHRDVDALATGSRLEAVAVHRQVDALQPDGQDERSRPPRPRLDSSGSPGCRRTRERPDPEQRAAEHRILDSRLDDAEDGQHGQAADDEAEDQRGRPAHAVPAVRLDAIGDADEHGDQEIQAAKVTLPHQSSFAGPRMPASRSLR